MGCHFLLQAIFPTQGLNLGLSQADSLLSEPQGRLLNGRIAGLDLQFYFYLLNYLFTWLCQALVQQAGSPIFVMAWQISSCSMWDLVPWSGIKPRCPALAVWSLSHWITGKVPGYTLKDASGCWVNDGWRGARVKAGTPEGAWKVDRGRCWRWRGLGYQPRVWVSDQTLSSLTPSLSPKNSPLLWVLLWRCRSHHCQKPWAVWRRGGKWCVLCS